MYEGEGCWAARTRLAELAGPNVDHTWPVATQPAPPVRPCLPQSSLASAFEAALCRQHGTCGLCSLPVWHPGHGRNAKRRLRPPPCCGLRVIGFVVRCSVCVQVVDVGMYVCGVVCYACCGVLQRRHRFNAFLKRFRKREPQRLVRHRLGTACKGMSVQILF